MPEPGEASGDPGGKTAALKGAILERGISLESVDDLDGALGTSSGGCIRLLNGLSPATEFTTLVHEYAPNCFTAGFVPARRCMVDQRAPRMRSEDSEAAALKLIHR